MYFNHHFIFGLNTFFPFLLGGLWSETAKSHASRWYFQGAIALLAGIIIALSWVIPAILEAGDAYGGTLIWHQTVDRMVKSFAHRRPFWWYFMLSPIILFPWFFWPRLWRQLSQYQWLNDSSFRLCMGWFIAGFIGFSLVSGKQIHYLLPLLPVLALMFSRVLSSSGSHFCLGELLPFALIFLFGISLLLLPYLHGITLYHWIQNRQTWWPLFILFVSTVWGIMRDQVSQRNAL